MTLSRFVRRSVALALAAAAITAVVGTVPAPAQTTVRLDVRLGIDGETRAGTPTPLTVVVDSGGFFAGSLEVLVQAASGVLSVRRSFQVPGGGRASIRMLVPGPEIPEVRAVDRSGRIAGRAVPGRGSVLVNEELVGILATEKPLAKRIDVEGVDRQARVVVVPQDTLDLGGDALSPLSHLVVDAELVPRLSDRQRAAVLSFATSGGELVAVARSEAALGFLPSTWRAAGGGDLGRTTVGSGRVTSVLTPEAPSFWDERDPRWSRVVRAADTRAFRREELTAQDWFGVLSESGGFRRPNIGWLLLFLLGYVTLAGPVNFLTLSALRRRELAWITVPALAVVFAAGAYFVGRGVRNVPILQGTGIAVVDPTSERTWLALGVLSRSGGTERVSVSGEWLVAPLPQIDVPGRQLPRVRVGGREQVAEFSLPIGAIGTLVAGRTRLRTSKDGGTLSAGADGFSGMVSNPTAFKLRDVGVYVGRAFRSIGELGPGIRKSVTVSVSAQGPDLNVDPSFLPGGSVGISLLQRAGRLAGLGLPGRAFLTGWVDLRDAADQLGIRASNGRLLVLVPLGLSLGKDKTVPSIAVRRSLVGTDGVFSDPSGMFVDQARNVTLRFDLPSGASPKSFAFGTQQGVGLFRGPDAQCKPLPGGGEQCFQVAIPEPPCPPGADCAIGQKFAPDQSVAVSVYDFSGRKWRSVSLKGDRIEFASAQGAARNVSQDGEVLVRLTSEFQTGFSVSSMSLEGIA